MTALSDNRSLDQVTATIPAVVQAPMAATVHAYMGSSLAPLTANGYVTIGGGVAATNACVGIAAHEQNNTGGNAAASVNIAQGVFRRVNSVASPVTQAYLGKPVYAEDDQTCRIASGATYPLLGIFCGFDADGTTPLVFVSGALNYLLSQGDLQADLASAVNAKGASMITIENALGNFLTAADVEAALNEIFTRLAAITATNGMNLLGYQDSGNKTLAATGDAALDELYVNATTAQGVINVPLHDLQDPDGDPVVKYSADPVPGFTLVDSKAAVLKWGSHATPDVVWGSIVIPPDLDDAANLVLHVAASKSGATLADAVTFTVEAFFQTVGALHDADVDCGGTTSAMIGDLAAKTISEVTLAIAAIDVPPAPSTMTFSIGPTDGLLGTDDVYVHRIWFEYTRKVLAS